MGLIREFREFAVKGNAVDIAVGLILGAAFSKVVSSIVDDVLMPPIGLAIGGVEFKDLQVVLRHAVRTATGEVVPAVGIRYGALIDTVIQFVIIAFSVFVVVKAMNRMIRRREGAAAADEAVQS